MNFINFIGNEEYVYHQGHFFKIAFDETREHYCFADGEIVPIELLLKNDKQTQLFLSSLLYFGYQEYKKANLPARIFYRSLNANEANLCSALQVLGEMQEAKKENVYCVKTAELFSFIDSAMISLLKGRTAGYVSTNKLQTAELSPGDEEFNNFCEIKNFKYHLARYIVLQTRHLKKEDVKTNWSDENFELKLVQNVINNEFCVMPMPLEEILDPEYFLNVLRIYRRKDFVYTLDNFGKVCDGAKDVKKFKLNDPEFLKFNKLSQSLFLNPPSPGAKQNVNASRELA